MDSPIELSLVIPAYQEENRIGQTMEHFSKYLEEHHPGAELLLVLDGCTDGTARVAREAFRASNCSLKVIEVPVNKGKGNAVKEGMLAARGEFCLFTDADMSFMPETIEAFLQKLKDGADIAIAQRQKTVVYKGIGRRTLAVLSRAIIGNIVLPGIRDTQAGFKAFRGTAAKELFSELKTPGYLFDLEILLAARRHGFRIDKVYVDWLDRPGSKVRIVRDSLQAGFDLILICLREAWTGCFTKPT